MGSRNQFGDTMPTNAHVYVGKKEINIVSLRLEQAFGKHHTFKIRADFDALGQDFMQNPMEHLKLIGKTVDIDIQQGDDSANAYMFRGIIQNVALEGQEGKHGYLILNGVSSTILLERGKRFDVFTNLTLQQVFDQVTDEIVSQKEHLPFVNSPMYNGQVEFLMQYNESDWEFLQRLSAISGETLYWTGRDLVFGTHKEWPTMEASYDKEIISFQFGNKFLANNFTRYQYLADRDDTITQDAPDRIKDANDYVNLAEGESKVLAEKRPVRTPVALQVADVGSLNELVEREKVVRASETVYVKGIAKTCDPRIGRLLDIKMPSTMQGAHNLGTYRITKVIHIIEQNYQYRCEFEGVPADLKFLPTPELKMPVADSIRGTVISNEDPQGQGRVRVDFPFASDRVSDAWLRVMTPNAGSSADVAKNRGLVFIPEKDDQVMVGFEFSDPNRPYVMGSMFHGQNAEGGGANNAIKSIITRSGIKIVFNDDEKSLHIEDPSGNTWDMDGKGNINVNAPETIALNAKNISMDASENISGHAGQSIDMHADTNLGFIAGDDCQISANNIFSQASEDSMHTAEKHEITANKVRVDSTGENLELASNSEVDIQSAKKVRLF